ncbi:MAG: aconitate hydratase AcnA [Calditrichaeota bacterium]|nr:aconitate hydratase AcnA [Calditrichota bacterium]
MTRIVNNSLGTRDRIDIAGSAGTVYRLDRLTSTGVADVSRLPYAIKILIEAVLRSEDGHLVTRDDIERLVHYDPASPAQREIPFMPARVLLQDFTGVPCVVDLAALRSAMARMGGDPSRINPLVPVDLVIDHSVQVDFFASADAEVRNAALEFERNRERYEFLKWGASSFGNFRVVPPSSGICHQVNLEFLASVVQARTLDGELTYFPDSLVGTDSHTPMVNGLSVLGWGVGGIEAEAAMLGQPLYFLMPEVIGFKLTGSLPPGATATDLVLRVTEMLRKRGVVDKFVEFFGPGVSAMSVPDRATISNMAPEYGATVGYFPIDHMTLEYLHWTGRPADLIARVERYAREQMLFRTDDSPDPIYRDVLTLDLETVEPSLAGPKRPQDRVSMHNLKDSFRRSLVAPFEKMGFGLDEDRLGVTAAVQSNGSSSELRHGSVVIAAITSCTNTSNPSVMLAAGLLAKNAIAAGLSVKPYVKTSLAPGSRVVTDYLKAAGLLESLSQIGFDVVGYGCTTCIGNSGPLPEPVTNAVKASGVVAAAVLSGNRNFPGRVHPLVKAAYLASPPLVVAYALAGSVEVDLATEPLGIGRDGRPVFLNDIWPTREEIEAVLPTAQDREAFRMRYDGIESSNPAWNAIETSGGAIYEWSEASTYIQEPPFFVSLAKAPLPIAPITGARMLVLAGDSITTDHISPAGNIAPDSPAGRFLQDKGVAIREFNQYGARRGNDRIMTRGTFANVAFRNQLGQSREGSWTTHFPSGELMSIYDASVRYRTEGTPLVVLAGNDYGMGSSRDWAAKGVFLLGVKAVIAQSFERIHRSNLVGMGVLPLQFLPGESAQSLGLTGSEVYTIPVEEGVKPGDRLMIKVALPDGESKTFAAICRLDSKVEVDYYRNGGILQTVLRRFLTG